MSSLKDLASLIMIPSLYKDGRLDTVKPLGNGILHPDSTGNNDGTDGSTPAEGNFTFSRGSNLAATRVASSGYIEKGRENLLVQSNQFDTTWVNANSSETSGQADKDGGTNAWKIDLTGVSGRIYQSKSQSGVVTFSVYAKKGTLDWVILSSNIVDASFNLLTGEKGTLVGGITSSIEDVGGGWYRCSFTGNGSFTQFRIYPAIADNTFTASSGNIYIQDAQLEQGMVASDVIETGTSAAQSGILEDMPRLDYSGGASCPSLLLEPQRTNVVSQSEYFGAWNTNGTASVTDNQSVSPEGVSNAALLDFGSTTLGANRIDLEPAISAGANYVFSVFVKNIDANRIGIRNYNTTKDAIANFDFSSGSFTDTNVNVIDTIVEPFSNGWYRIGIVFNSGVDTTADLRISPDTTSGSDGEQIYIYGASLEQASYPTSYIPTYGSSVTRSADYMQVIPTDLLGSDSGTWFMELNDMTFDIAGTQVPTIYLGDSTTNCLAIEPKSAANNKGIFLVKEESNVSTTLYDFTISGKTKFCFVWSGTTLKVFRDGVQRYSATNFNQPANWDSFVFNHGTREAFSEIPSILLFPTALTDSECIALTTL